MCLQCIDIKETQTTKAKIKIEKPSTPGAPTIKTPLKETATTRAWPDTKEKRKTKKEKRK